MNLCCIEWFQYNLEIWSKKGTWHTLVAFSDLCMMKAKCVCPGVTQAHPKEPIPAAAGQGSSSQTLAIFSPKLPFQHAETFLGVVQGTKDAWIKPAADSWLASKAAFTSRPTEQKYSIKYWPHLYRWESKALPAMVSVTDDDYSPPVRQPETAPSSQKSP